ncbi:MAG: YcxB family protein [Lachnospiraceae bacterium]|nr:YcxB family protein [Lachnospiraceae bacterium]
MRFEYKYKVKISDLWQASMYYAYSSYLAIINIICIISAAALLIKLWATSPPWFRCFLVLFLMLFTVIQPVTVWFRSKRQLAGNLPDLTLVFTDEGISITADGEHQEKKWDQVRAVVKKPTIVVLYMADGMGYILRNSVLGNTKEEFVAFVREKIRNDRMGQS